MAKKGFTLVEIMIVVAIIGVLSAIAIPNLLRARIAAQESGATSALHTILAAEHEFRLANPTYADLAALGLAAPPYVDGALASGTKQGYNFQATPTAGARFYATAVPQVPAQAHTFYIDEGGVLCRSTATNVADPGAHIAPGEFCPPGFTELE